VLSYFPAASRRRALRTFADRKVPLLQRTAVPLLVGLSLIRLAFMSRAVFRFVLIICFHLRTGSRPAVR
jgi:hypothetical protein